MIRKRPVWANGLSARREASCALIHTGFVYYLFFDSLRNLSARIISALIFVDPAVAILLDTVFTGFRPTVLQLAGIVLIFAGIPSTVTDTSIVYSP
ncbi:DMT family transporter [Bacillus paralicheniformis]|uniref:DMT family transporter n=1 Tax=Bacillus paralicheniformis TaxID=1648923 RepID=UPI0021A7425B|nr:DMT family transporter [Bacillus paralicheniformis]UWS64109.1 DMT family transporter [Bacillus paralicheniformis]